MTRLWAKREEQIGKALLKPRLVCMAISRVSPGEGCRRLKAWRPVY